MAHADSNGVKIHYDVIGSGKPIVLIHGFAATADENWSRTGWYQVLNRAGRQVIACDLRGHGKSDMLYEGKDYDLQKMADDVIAVMDDAGIQRADVIGYSMGARITARLLARHQDRLNSAVMGGMGSRFLEGPAVRQSLVDALLTDDLSTIKNDVARGFRLYAEQQNLDRRALAACADRPASLLAEEDFSGVRIPALVVVGQLDDIAGKAEPVAKLIPGAKAVTIPGTDHMYTIPHAMFKANVVDFLSGWLDA